MFNMISKYLLALFVIASAYTYYKYTNLRIEQLKQEVATYKRQLQINHIVCDADKNISLIRKDFENAKQDKNITDGNHSYSFDWAF